MPPRNLPFRGSSSHLTRPAHTCHAHGCGIVIPPRLFMCRQHWYSLSRRLQTAIWREYRSGQERDKKPSLRYLAVAQRAIGELAFLPDDEQAAAAAAPYLLRAEVFRNRAIGAGGGDPLPWLPRHSDLLPVEGSTAP